jgi:hypothetical protein
MNFGFSQHVLPCVNRKQMSLGNIVVSNYAKYILVPVIKFFKIIGT